MPPQPKTLIKQEDIEKAVDRLAVEIRRDYKGKNPLLIGILKGSFIFMADLVRKLAMPLEVDFVSLSSYGKSTQSSGRIKVMSRLSEPVTGRHVIVVEDIVDTGLTTRYFIRSIGRKRPASVKLCVLADKSLRHKTGVKIDYLGFAVPDKFIVGYGIDWDGKYRYLPDIRYIENK